MAFRSRKRPKISGRRVLFEALEERIVMDAAVDSIPQGGPSLHGMLLSHQGDVSHDFLGVHKPLLAALLMPQHMPAPTQVAAPEAAIIAPPAPEPIQVPAADSPASVVSQVMPAPAMLKATAAPTASEKGLDVIVVSGGLEDAYGVINAAAPDAQVVLYDDATDNLRSLNAMLSAMTQATGKKIDTLAVAAHGDPGVIGLGSQQIKLDNSAEFAGEFSSLAQNLSPNAQIQLFGCAVASNDEGRALVQNIADMTGAKVFASSDVTGASPNNWNLEFATKPGEMNAALEPVKLESVKGELAQAAVTAIPAAIPYIEAETDEQAGSSRFLTVNGTQAAFTASDATNLNGGFEVWRTNGTTAGAGQTVLTTLANVVDPHIRELTLMGGNVYFTSIDANNALRDYEVMQTNPGAGGQTRVSEFGGNFAGYDPEISQLTASGNSARVYFTGHQPAEPGTAPDAVRGYELFSSTGGVPAVGQISDGNPLPNIGNITQFNRANFWTAITGTYEYDPHITSVTAATTGTTVYFVGNSPWLIGRQSAGDLLPYTVVQGQEVYRSDGLPPALNADALSPFLNNPDVTDDSAGFTERGAISAFGVGAIDGIDHHNYQANIYGLAPARDGSLTVYFVGNEPGLGYEIWRSNGIAPAGLGVVTANPNGNAGFITNFAELNPNIGNLVTIAGTDDLYFTGQGAAGVEVWRSNGGAPAGGVTDLGDRSTAFGLANPSISQLLEVGGTAYFVADGGTNGTPNYEIYRWDGQAAGTQIAITDFNQTAIAAPTLGTTAAATLTNNLDPLRSAIPAHRDPHIQLLAVNGNTLWFAADSEDNRSREIYSVDRTVAAAVKPAQRTDFRYSHPDFEALTVINGNVIFGATEQVRDATGALTGEVREEIFTIQNNAPVIQDTNAAEKLLDRAIFEDNLNTNLAVPMPNLIRVGDPDQIDPLTVRVISQTGFSQQTDGASVVQPALNFTSSANVLATRLNNITFVADPAADGRTWEIAWNPAVVPVDPWTQQNEINAVLATLAVMPDRDTNWNTDAQIPTTHTIRVQAFDAGTGVPAPAQRDLVVQVQPVNDVPLLNTAYPGQAALAAFPAGPYNVPVGESLVFNAANTRQIIVGDVDARESIAGQPPQQAMDNGILRTRLSASGLGTLTLAQTTGLTFINPGAANDGTGDQNMLFYGTITNINAALNGMRFTPNANDFATGSVQINVAVDDINPVTDPTTPDGTWRTGHRFGVAVDPITNPSLTGPSGAQDPVTRSITVNVTPPAGDFWGRWPRIGTSTL